MRLKAQTSCFAEVAHTNLPKYQQHVAGDVFHSRVCEDNSRLIAVLSDGLGSGVKANVLATLTTTMAVAFTAADDDYTVAAELILKTLPICKERQIAYSTFSILDIDAYGFVKIFEYETPNFILIRDAKIIVPEKVFTNVKSSTVDERQLACSKFKVQLGDRIIICSDGVTQAGMGILRNSCAWGQEKLREFCCFKVKENPNVSAKDLANEIVEMASSRDIFKPKDDISCATIYFREPRNLLITTGPPMSIERDRDLARIVAAFDGKKVVCGGTTADIIAREFDTKIKMNVENLDPNIPPTAEIEGLDLVTEGALTLDYVLTILEDDQNIDEMPINGATNLVKMILESDAITFLVGTKINQANVAPDMPIELDLRKNIVRRITKTLNNKFLKETEVRFI